MSPRIIQSMLLGAGRRPLTTADFPETVRIALEKMAETRPEAIMLSGSAIMQAREKAASLPKEDATPVLPFTLPDQETPPIYSALLARIFQRPDLFAPLAALLFEKMLLLRVTMPATWLVAVLNAGTSRKFHTYRSLIKQVSGKRGEWLAQFNPAWSYVLREMEQMPLTHSEPPAIARKRTQNTIGEAPKSDIQKEKEALTQLDNRAVEAYFMLQRTHENPYFLTDAIVRPGIRWSPGFTHFMLEAMNTEDFIHHHADAPLRLAMQFHDSAIPVLKEWLSLTPRDWQDQQLHKKVLSPLLDFLMLRAEIDSIVKEG